MSRDSGVPDGAAAVVARAPAKVNVHLAVGPLRPDGFHELRTVYLAVSLFDTVTVRPGDGLSLTVSGEGGRTGRPPPTAATSSGGPPSCSPSPPGSPADAHLEIAKSIPAAAGLAGGSADAAAALVALDALWGTRAGREDLAGLAAQLGSDVPFSLLGGVALGSGRGEQLSPVLARTRSDWVLGIAGEGLVHARRSTRELDRLRAAGRVPDGTDLAPAEPVIAALRSGPPAALAAALANDLQAPALALRPELRRALRGGDRRRRGRGAGERLRARRWRRWPTTSRAPSGWPRRWPGPASSAPCAPCTGPCPGARLVG